MILFPAIDMIDGACVRLVRGDYATAAQVADDILEAARRFAAAGCNWLHMVDLEGAKQKKPVNSEQVRRVLEQTGLRVQVGGGIRTLADMEFYRGLGVHRMILGSVAVNNKPLTKLAVSMFGERLAVGIDARGGIVATNGWLEESDVDFITLAKEMEAVGVKTIIYTDISRDGTLEGLNLGQLEALRDAVSCDIIASGGVAGLADIVACKKLGLYGVICGKALYNGALDLKEALRAARARVL